jgi:prolyl oligopeptidase
MSTQKRLAALLFITAAVLAACGGHPSVTPRAPGGGAPATIPTTNEKPGMGNRTRKDDTVDDIHGTKVADPYRWLEDGDAPEVKAWTDAQNAETQRVLGQVPGRAQLEARTKELLQVGLVTAPAVRRGEGLPTRYFHTKRVGEQEQPVLYVREGRAGADRVLIDPMKLTDDPTTALDWWYPSKDGTLLAYGFSKSGDEDSTLHVRDVATGADLSDAIPYTRRTSVAWVPDKKGFYYTRYPAPGTVPAGEEQYHAKIFFHRLGNDWKHDRLIFESKGAKEDVPYVLLSPNGRWLVAGVFIGWDRTEVYVRDRSKGDAAPWVPVAVGIHAVFNPDPRDERLYIHTNDGAPAYRVFAAEYDHTDRSLWREVIKEGKDTLDGAHVLGDEIVATYLHEASTRIERFTLAGKSKGTVALPSLGTAAVSGPVWGGEAFVQFASFVHPSEVLHVDLASGKETTWDRVGEGFAAPDVDVSLHYATSKDGTKVPMFVVARKGLVTDGNNPTLLWGYGGFNQNLTPAFSTRALLTVENGGVWVQAVLRGGGELGEAWHQAGMLARKQNVFDDFYACAQALFDEKITSPEKLGIVGGSNGGLLVAAAVTQHPEMFRVAESLVPLTDMIRYPRYRIARFWIPEYGDPSRPEDFAWLYAYSPYHHVKDGTKYPATLFATAESDSRVDPMHARKMAARMQEAQGDSTRPILLRVESKAGHGAGKPVTKLVEEVVDEMAFAFSQLGVKGY